MIEVKCINPTPDSARLLTQNGVKYPLTRWEFPESIVTYLGLDASSRYIMCISDKVPPVLLCEKDDSGNYIAWEYKRKKG